MENKGNLALSTVNRLLVNDYYFTTPSLLKTEIDGVNALKMVFFFSLPVPKDHQFQVGLDIPET